MQDDDDAWQNPPQDTPEAADDRPGQQIDFDLNCVRCGYNLRGINARGRCPECGEPVETTLRPDLLHMASPAWLGKLRKGSNWLIAAILMSLAMIPVGIIIGIATATSDANANLSLAALIFLSVLALIITLTYGVAVWLITEPEPGVLDNRTSRSLTRWLIVPAMLISMVVEFLNYTGQPSAMVAGAAIDFISSIMLLIGFLAGMWYLRLLADRIPEPSLAKQTMTVYWGYLVTMSITILFTAGFALFAIAAASSTTPNAAMGAVGALGLLMCPVGLAMFVFLIWWIVLMFRYRTRFTQAHQIALSQQHRANPSTLPI